MALRILFLFVVTWSAVLSNIFLPFLIRGPKKPTLFGGFSREGLLEKIATGPPGRAEKILATLTTNPTILNTVFIITVALCSLSAIKVRSLDVLVSIYSLILVIHLAFDTLVFWAIAHHLVVL